MGELNPGRLAVILEDLQEEIVRWTTVAGDTIHAASYAQRYAEEQVIQTLHRAYMVENNATQDMASVKEVDGRLQVLFSKCQEAKELSYHALEKGETLLVKAEEVLAYWQSELVYALAWMEQAKDRVYAAERELEAAQSDLRWAKSELADAERALNDCLNYRDDRGRGRDCSGARSRVRQAQAAVNAAVDRVQAAEIELIDARAELARAQARVRCCQIAVENATGAVNTAREAVSRANMAVNAAERSLESAMAGQRFFAQALRKAQEEEEEAQAMLRETRSAEKLTGEGRFRYQNAERAEESAQHVLIMAGKELDERIARLHELNRPEMATPSRHH